MQTWLNIPCIAVSGHATALLNVVFQSVALVKMLSYYSHVNLTRREFPNSCCQVSASIHVSIQAFSSLTSIHTCDIFKLHIINVTSRCYSC
nr:unnamed protein product [Callosobruchus chinensis]